MFGGLASGTQVSNGGVDIISAGGIASGTVLNSGAREKVDSLGTASGSVIGNGGRETLLFGGTAKHVVVNSGGRQTVFAGGAANTTTINNGGAVFVDDDVVAVGDVVNGGGTLFLFAGGVDSTTTVSSGGQEVLFSGPFGSNVVAKAGASIVDSGALVFTNAGRVVFAGNLSGGGTVTEAGSGTLVLATLASAFSGTATMSVGTLELFNGITAGSGTILFAGSGTKLKIDGTLMPRNTISGFTTGQVINLASILSAAGETASDTGTTLTIKNSSGTALAKLTIAGTHTTSSFSLSADPVSGIDIRGPVATTTAASAGCDTVAAGMAIVGNLPQLASNEHVAAASGNATLHGGLVFPSPPAIANSGGGVWLEVPGVPAATANFNLATSPEIAFGSMPRDASTIPRIPSFTHPRWARRTARQPTIVAVTPKCSGVTTGQNP